MIRVIVCALALAMSTSVVFAGTKARVKPQQTALLVQDVPRVQPPPLGAHAAAMREFKKGNFKPLEEFLKQELAWHLQTVREHSVNLEAIRDSIIDHSVEKGIMLTEQEMARSIEAAVKLVHGPGGGILTEARRGVHAAAEHLSFICLLKSDFAGQEKYQKLAMQFE